jgi:ribonuclease P protein component
MLHLIEMAMTSRRLGLPRQRRVRAGRDFVRIKTDGRRLTHGSLIFNWLPLAQGQGRLGVITSRKVGAAVVRNRMRRLLRESWRCHQHEISSPIDLVLVARPSIAGKTMAAVEADFLAGLRRAGLLKASP